MNKEHIGFTIIDHLSSKCIFYKEDVHPNENIIEGLDNIDKVVNFHIATIPYIKNDGHK